jgi:hypothetical protein
MVLLGDHMPEGVEHRRVARWYIRVDGKDYGPYDPPTLSAMIERGQVLASDRVAQEGAQEWIAAADDPQLGLLFRHKPGEIDVEPRAQRRRSQAGAWAGRLGLALFFLPIAWLAWPYYAAFSLAQAVREGDTAVLEKRVDWNNLRQSLRGDLNAQFLPSVNAGNDNPTATGLAAVFGPAIVDRLIDSYVTPQAIATLRRAQIDAAPTDDQTANIEKSVGAMRSIHWQQVKYAFFAGSPLSFRVDVLPEGSPPAQKPIGLEFAWSGDWRLTRIRFPDNFFNDLNRSRPTSSATANAGARSAVPPQPSRLAEPSLIDMALRSKRFKPADYRANDFEAAILFELSIANRSAKDIRAFDGIVKFTDLLDNEVFSSKIALNNPITAGSTINWSGQVKYNQFIDSHNALKNEDLANLKTKFALRKILYADGTTREFP